MSEKTTVRENIENLLFRRNELKVDVEMEITPSREDAKQIVCDAVSCSPDVVRIIKVDSRFGERLFTIIAEVYNSVEDLKEYSPMLKKKDIEFEKKKAEAAAAAKAEEEKPVEEALKEEAAPEAEASVEEKPAKVPVEEIKEGKAE